MKKGSLKKYILPNMPYVFMAWACLKLGTAYRLAAGANAGEKLVGMMNTINTAFASPAPGLVPADWLVGIAGAAAIRLFVYVKAKNAKKFRRDEEYGSARWGGPKDIAPFVDPRFEKNVILSGTEFLTTNTRPKNPANARNLNACVIGSSGSGKTRFWLTPQLLQAHSSYVVVDPKGGVLSQVGYFLQRKKGYKIKVFNSIDFSRSMHYNPLAYIKNEADILKFVNTLIANTKGEGKEGGPVLDQIGDAFILRPDCLYHLRGAGGGPEHEHAGRHDFGNGSERGRPGYYERHRLYVQGPGEAQAGLLRREAVQEVQISQRQDCPLHTY